MKQNIALLAIVTLALLFPKEAVAKPKSNSKPRPFKATFSTEFFNPTLLGNVFTTVVSGEGKATHLGNCSITAEHNFAFTTPTLTAGIAWNGVMQLGASNGDILNATYVGDIVLSGAPEIPFLLLFTVTFDGGTGRFENASGSADVIGLTTIEPDPNTGYFKGTSAFSFEGTIAY